jgi:hypothetical protein
VNFVRFSKPCRYKKCCIKKFEINYDRQLKKAMKGNINFEDGIINKQYQGNIVGLGGSEATVKLENGSIVDIPYNMLRKIE